MLGIVPSISLYKTKQQKTHSKYTQVTMLTICGYDLIRKFQLRGDRWVLLGETQD